MALNRSKWQAHASSFVNFTAAKFGLKLPSFCITHESRELVRRPQVPIDEAGTLMLEPEAYDVTI